MKNRTIPKILLLFVFCATVFLHAATAAGQEPASSIKQLSPQNQQAIQMELQKAGINLTPADIQKGKEILEKAEAAPDNKTKEKEAVQKEVVIRAAEKPPAQTVEEVSLFSRTRATGKYQDISLDLKPFGYQFFQESTAVSVERKDIPVPLNYIIGSGDQVNILLWGRINAQHSLTVDREGKITIPQIGPVYVAGMTYEQMSKHVISKAEQIVGTNIDVTIGSARSIPIFVLGDVKKAGAYTIGALATITDALMAAGGPSSIGSMRHIEVRRKNKVITYFDLYDFFLKGDKSRDVTLQAGDVIFVPTTGPLVGIAGNVKRPAIYELKDKFDLQHVIEMAGGIIPSGYTQQMQVERIIKNEKQVVIDINDKTLGLVRDFVIQDADLVKVFSIVDTDENSVYLNGNVKRPGKYAFKPGMRITDLIKTPQDLQKETYFGYALIKRQSPPDNSVVLLPFNLGRILLQNDLSQNFELTPKDQVFIFNKHLFVDHPFVTVQGEVRGGSTADSSASNAKMDIQDEDRDKKILAELKSIKEELNKDVHFYIYTARIEEIEHEVVAEKRPTPGAMRYLQTELEKTDRKDLTARLKKLEAQMQVTRRMELLGNMKVKDAILNAGGLTSNASLENGEIIRQHAKNEYKTIYFNVGAAMADDPRSNVLLQDRDQIIIHSVWETNPRSSVFISGDVTNPGTYQYTEKMTVRDLVFKAGNVLESAYLDDAEITSMEIVEGKMGRLTHKNIDLRKALADDPAHNLTLAVNDRLLIKQIADYQAVRFVNLSGQITFAGRYPFKKGQKLSELIERAGGYLPNAYLRGAYFTRARVRELQQKGLEDMIDRMEKDLLSGGAVQISSSVSPEEIAAKKVELEQRHRFIDTLRKVRATGRMTIYLTELKAMKGTEFDFELEDDDSLVIPEKNSVVTVIGSVMTQSSHLYSDKLSYQDYIDATGGYSYYADKGNVYVLKVDGSARKVARGFLGWNSSPAQRELTAYGGEVRQIEPGDTIVVPEKPERIAWLREIKDITQILMNIAVVAGVTIKLF
ncbi:MAG: hypothetical protein EG826_15365 [Deltaproteobacteria bacterium]|nr:hypothetical protein [Deltaproteobacteria bacterium]